VSARAVDREAGEKLGSMAAGVDDTKDLGVGGKPGGEIRVREGRAAKVIDADTVEN
jgi:hypothetical protein